jgi:hypothetical protein
MDRQQLISALLLAATALFLIAVAPGFRYRRVTRIAALAVYAIALGVALVFVGLWLAGIDIGR